MKHETIHGIVSFLGGICVFLLGGFDSLLTALLIIMAADWITGVLRALKNNKFSTTVGVWGVVNKVVYLIVVVTVNFMQRGVLTQIPIRESVIIMFLINEGLSVLRNASYFVRGLEPLTKYFENVKVNVLKIFTVGGNENEL